MSYSLESLKKIADKIGVEYRHNTGAKTLLSEITTKCEEFNTSIEEVAKDVGIEESSEETQPDVLEQIASDPSTRPEPKAKKKKEIDLSKATFASLEASAAEQDEETRLKEANKLVRVLITCNHRDKVKYTGEIFAVRNAKVGEIKKFVQYNVPTHVPQIILNYLEERQIQIFVPIKLPNGIPSHKPKQIKEYNISYLGPITKEEVEVIKRRQLADGYEGGDS